MTAQDVEMDDDSGSDTPPAPPAITHRNLDDDELEEDKILEDDIKDGDGFKP